MDDFILGEYDDGCIRAKTDKGKSIEVYECPVDVKHFFRKATVLYGPSGSGKTILTKYIMRKLVKCFPTVIVFCPTNSENAAFTNIVPAPFIYDKVDTDRLKKIYSRAQFASKVYKCANKLEILRELFLKIADIKQQQNEKWVMSQKSKSINEVRSLGMTNYDTKREIEKIIENANEVLRKLYKTNIKHAASKGMFNGIQLTEAQSTSLKYVSYNPEILIVFDDCAAELNSIARKASKDDTLVNFFFKGRHSHLTTIYTMQDDSSLPAPLRKNAHNSIFCTRESATGFFTRGSNNISTIDKKLYCAAAEEVFKSHNQYDYKKLIFLREDPSHPVQYIKGDEDDFRMCADIIWEFCEKVKKTDDSIEDDGEWSKYFFE